MPKPTRAAASVPYDPARFLRADDLAGFLAEALADGDHRALPIALRTVADVLGMAELARRTGLSRETLYRAHCPTKAFRAWTLWARSWALLACG